LKYSSAGALDWYSTYDGPDHLGSSADCIGIDSAKNVYVVGANGVPYPGLYNNTLVKMNANGVIQWAGIYKGIGGNNQCWVPAGIAVTADGNTIYYATSCYVTSESSSDFVTLRYAANGDSIWVRRFYEGNQLQNNPASLLLGTDGNIYICGAVNSPNTGDDFVTLKYANTGALQWVATYNGFSNYGDGALDLTVDTGLNVYVTGSSSNVNNSNTDAVTIKYSQTEGINTNNNELPIQYKLSQNYPNPFNNTTLISYQLPKKSKVTLILYNLLGQLLRTIVNSDQEAGYYNIMLNLDNLASGVYLYTLILNDIQLDTKKLILLK